MLLFLRAVNIHISLNIRPSDQSSLSTLSKCFKRIAQIVQTSWILMLIDTLLAWL